MVVVRLVEVGDVERGLDEVAVVPLLLWSLSFFHIRFLLVRAVRCSARCGALGAAVSSQRGCWQQARCGSRGCGRTRNRRTSLFELEHFLLQSLDP